MKSNERASYAIIIVNDSVVCSSYRRRICYRLLRRLFMRVFYPGAQNPYKCTHLYMYIQIIKLCSSNGLVLPRVWAAHRLVLSFNYNFFFFSFIYVIIFQRNLFYTRQTINCTPFYLYKHCSVFPSCPAGEVHTRSARENEPF